MHPFNQPLPPAEESSIHAENVAIPVGGVKNPILSGDMRELPDRVVEAEKAAPANVIKRRRDMERKHGRQAAIDHAPVPARIWTEDVTHDAVRQLEHVARLPFVHSHVAAMPDVHVGVGSAIGSVIPTRGAIIPAAVGVDIGCGMIAARLSIDADTLPDSLGVVHTLEQVV